LLVRGGPQVKDRHLAPRPDASAIRP
jgi:hypothetical protein